MIPTIGVIGNGFVGGALARGFSLTTDVKVFDLDPDLATHPYSEVVDQDLLFLAVPTPMHKSGVCDTRILLQALNSLDLELEYKKSETKKTVIIRSTIPPEFLSKVYSKYPNLSMIYMPEFLTERTADLDFIQSRRFIFGTAGGWDIPHKLHLLFETRFPRTPQRVMTWEAASLVKLGTNGFFTVKLSYFNELAQYADHLGEAAQPIIDEICNDGRIGISHNQVPGHDGDRGWGGHCFPKDNRSLAKCLEEKDIHPWMLNSAWTVNESVRKNKDWEEMKGRAVSDDES